MWAEVGQFLVVVVAPPFLGLYFIHALFFPTVWRTDRAKPYRETGVRPAQEQLPLVVRIRSYVATRILSSLLLTCVFMNVFCLLHLRRVAWWYIPYAIWCIFLAERFGKPLGLPSKWLRTLPFWNWLAEYFPFTLLKENPAAQFATDKNYLFGFHPHGVLGFSCCGQFAGMPPRPENNLAVLLPGLDFRVTTLEVNMRTPFFRHILQLLGFISCSKGNIQRVLESQEKGKAVVLLVGGGREALMAEEGKNNLVLQRRKGFFELALRTGASVVPVYALGENDLYTVIKSPLAKLLSEQTMRLFGFSCPLFFGRGAFQMFLPLRVPTFTMIGDPIECKKTENATDEDIARLRQQYCEALHRVFNKVKDAYRPKREFQHLRIVE
ncbi:Diacylglycerol acyl transferase, related [Neospora caninum Liverpool]|uniref:Acyltransferase n=1 Tax=Neospora caninum (strain Liverpool) TaxID=572307 RepID=F0VLU9_NEOCL|nr:Diacylglycerol acyl transferase, related [Neospora caninum Liverpool]CBZ54227.1 Diacylglycerol acyl transferase, related [Neospora caninum Liverpool]CEL68928.1 TPA: Diacylglycerol acyl transferase, related [Neospora caninum Liverpool]|eukprot:XP_003884258.1 Diacylglycerol acyl transferase, related [Neospora caninum Liverpool]